MTCAEMIFRIIEVVIAASVPVLVVIFGLKLTKRSEEIKNESASKHLWRTKWIDVLFQKHLAFCDKVIDFTSGFARLPYLEKMGKVNTEEWLELQNNINESTHKINRAIHDLQLFSINVIGEDEETFFKGNEIEQLLWELSRDMNYIFENRRVDEQANLETIFYKLAELNRVTEELIQKKFK